MQPSAKCTWRLATSISRTSPINTLTFAWSRKMRRMGVAIELGFSAPVATW